jgi:hypothetical protein
MATEAKLGGDVKGALALALVLTLVALGIGDSSLGIAVTFLDFIIFVFVMSRVPVRLSMMTLMFFVFALPNPAEGQPTEWVPPFSIVGAILLNHLNTIDRSIGAFSSFSFSGMDLMLAALGLIILYRKNTGSTIDTLGRLTTPKPLVTLAFVSLGGTGFVWISGLVRGGDFGMSLWQLNCVMYLPVLFLIFQYALRGPADHGSLAKVLLAAATYKCILAEFIVTTITVPMDPETGSTRPAYATSHTDSMLFAAAFVLILAPLVERVSKKAKWHALVFLPILAMGTAANNRRLAWVQVALVFLTVYFISRESPIKRKLRRGLFALSPFIAGYIAAGWNSQFGATFKPVRMIRSIVDAKTDASSLWREYENVDIIATFRSNPLFGTGYGHPYEEIVVLPAVDYPLERYTPHNSLLGLWGYGGATGYAALTLLWMAGVYFAMRAYYKGTDRSHRAAALVAFGAVLAYLLQSWGDLGLGTWTGVFLMGCSLACAGKLAVATGQWGPPSKAANPAVRASATQ